jgi:hypothetical protein
MNRLKLTKERRERFLQTLADTGSVTAAIADAGTSRTRVYELRKTDPAFASAWREAEEMATDRLEDEARRRAIEGVPEPLVSAGKLVRDDDGQPITVRRYSDHLLMALLKAHRPSRRERSVRFQLPALRSAADAASAIGSAHRWGCRWRPDAGRSGRAVEAGRGLRKGAGGAGRYWPVSGHHQPTHQRPLMWIDLERRLTRPGISTVAIS